MVVAPSDILFVLPCVFVGSTVLAVVAFPWTDANARRSVRYTALCVAPPIACSLWACLFSVPAGSYPARPFWVEHFFTAQFVLSGALVAVSGIAAPAARWFAVYICLAAFCVTLAVGFLGVMQVGGASL